MTVFCRRAWSVVNLTGVYFREYRRASRESTYELPLWVACREFPAWILSQDSKAHPKLRDRPWLSSSAVEKLAKLMPQGATVFEYGSGSSTMFFLRRGATVHSVEHDGTWFSIVREAVADQQLNRWKGFLRKPIQTKTKATECISDHPDWTSHDFSEYVTVIEEYPDRSFDIILIDGRSRPACLFHALPKVRPGGVIVFDNVERKRYRDAIRTLDDSWWVLVLGGPTPRIKQFTQTAFIFRHSAAE